MRGLLELRYIGLSRSRGRGSLARAFVAVFESCGSRRVAHGEATSEGVARVPRQRDWLSPLMATLVRIVFPLANKNTPCVSATHRKAGVSENYPWFSSRIVGGHESVNSAELLASID